MKNFFSKLEQTTLLIIIHRIVNVIFYFIGSYLVIYFLKNTNWNLKIISIYYILSYITGWTTFYLLSKFIKNTTVIRYYKIGIIFQVVFLLIILGIKTDMAKFMIPLGMLAGVVGGLYWLPRNFLVFELNKSAKASKFFAVDEAINKIQTIIMPAAMGGLIGMHNSNYTPLFIILILILAVALALTSFINLEDVKVNNIKIKRIKKFMSLEQFGNIKRMYIADIFNGLSSGGVLSTIILILTFTMYNTEVSLGIYNSIIALVTAIIMVCITRYIKDIYFSRILKITGFLVIGILLVVTYFTNDATFLAYNIITGIGFSVIQMVFDSNFVKLIRQKETRSYLLENILLREFWLDVGRIIGYLMLYLLANIITNITSLRVILTFIAVNILFRTIYVNQALLEKKEEKVQNIVTLKCQSEEN